MEYASRRSTALRVLAIAVLLVAASLLLNGSRAHATGNTIIELGGADFAGESTSLVVDADGHPVVGYIDELHHASVVRCGDPSCTSGNVRVWSGERATDLALALDADDRPVLVYSSGPLGELRLLHCGTPVCDVHNTLVTLVAGAGQYPSLVLDAAGNPVVVYQGASETGLNVVRCAEPSCSGAKVMSSPTPGAR